MSFTMRKMAATDLDAVLRIEQGEPQAPHWSRGEYELCLVSEPNGPLRRAAFVAESQGGLIGFAVAKWVVDICELESIVVRKQDRRQGIGAALLQAVTNWAEAVGAVRLELEVRISNTSAIHLYERAGLRAEGFRRSYYRHPEEGALLMSAGLRSSGKLP